MFLYRERKRERERERNIHIEALALLRAAVHAGPVVVGLRGGQVGVEAGVASLCIHVYIYIYNTYICKCI